MTEQEELFIRNELRELLKDPKFRQMDTFIQHGDVTCLRHCISVAYLSYAYCIRYHVKADMKSLIRGAMLHDYFLYDWHIKNKGRKLHGFYHPIQALKNADRDFNLTNIEKDIILNHMWPLTFLHWPHYRESRIVCLTDKMCSLSETFGMSIWQYDLAGV